VHARRAGYQLRYVDVTVAAGVADGLLFAPMSEQSMIRILGGLRLRGAAAVFTLALTLPACGGAVTSGVVVGKVGEGLSAHAHAAPQGAAVCALQEALAAPAAGAEKPTSETCAKAAKSDQLWHRAMLVLAAYGETLETLASGEGTDTTGQLEAAETGVRGNDWIDVDSAPEQSARTAVSQLVTQMSTNSAKGDLAATVKAAAPHVKTLCDGLTSYLETQARSLADIERDAEKRRAARTERRCGALDTRPVCVGDSMVDRMVYGGAFGQMATLETSHLEAHDAVAGFCAAHIKLDAAATAGNLSKDQTYRDVVEAVKSVHRTPPQVGSGKAADAPAKK
jgi:hypothetical protein